MVGAFKEIIKLRIELLLHPLQVLSWQREESAILDRLHRENSLEIKLVLIGHVFNHDIKGQALILRGKYQVDLAEMITLINFQVDHVFPQGQHEARRAARQKVDLVYHVRLVVEILFRQYELLL